MTVPRSFPVFAVVFAVAYSVAYALSVWNNYALFTYHPATNELAWGAVKPKDGGLAMYWYGWIATSAIVASIAALAASFLPEPVTRRIWPGLAWLVPICGILFFVWLLRGYFLR
jgi:hypothetical protein